MLGSSIVSTLDLPALSFRRFLSFLATFSVALSLDLKLFRCWTFCCSPEDHLSKTLRVLILFFLSIAVPAELSVCIELEIIFILCLLRCSSEQNSNVIRPYQNCLAPAANNRTVLA